MFLTLQQNSLVSLLSRKKQKLLSLLEDVWHIFKYKKTKKIINVVLINRERVEILQKKSNGFEFARFLALTNEKNYLENNVLLFKNQNI